MNQTANQTTFDLMDKLLNASAINNRASRKAPSPFDAFDGVELYDEASQDLLNDVAALECYSNLQRSMLRSISRNLMSARSRGWRILYEDFRAFTFVANQSMAMLQEIFNNAVDTVR